MPCDAIKHDGVPCGARAKNGGKCGTHAKSTATPANYVGFLAARYSYIIGPAIGGTNYGVPFRMHAVLRESTREQLMTWIEEAETILRPHFPGYTGPFCSSNFLQINNARVMTPRQRAEARVPRHIAHQAHLLHEWAQHFHTLLLRCLRIVPDRAPAIPPRIDDIYTPEYITTQVRPYLVMNWAHFPGLLTEQLHRCFLNMGILGQTEIRDISTVVPAFVAARNEFVADNQNVHRTETVKYVTDIYKKLCAIAVPADQRTVAELLYHCKLGDAATLQFVKHYLEPVDIYEISKPYPKAIDGVWAYIRVHPEKEELYVRVRDELEDNVGMCAQGNLSRLCNILSGYLDGITPPVAKGELTQQKIAAIANDDEGNKVARGRVALRELGVPEDDWAPWIEALEAME
jgi:hypothetical protein